MKKKKQSNLSVLMGYAKGHRFFTYAALVLSAISGVISLFPFIFIWRIIKEAIEVAPNFGNATDMVKNGWLAVAFSLAYIVVYFGALICSHVAAFRVQRNIQGKVLDHISTLPIGEIGEFGSGRLRSIVLESSAATETYLAHQLPDMVQAIMTPLAMVVMLFVFDWRLGLVSLLPVALGIAAIFPMAGPRMKDDIKNYQDAIGEMNNEAVEYVRGIPVVKTFNQSVFSFKRFSAAIAKYGKYCVDYTRVCRKYMIMSITAINSVVCFLAAFALIIDGVGLTDGPFIINLLFYIVFTPIISTSFTKIIFMSENGILVNDALRRIDGVLSAEPLKEAKNPQKPDGYAVEFKDVSFRYKDGTTDAIDGVSFTVPENGLFALVGPSGGGKSTIASLLARFYDVKSGSVRIGGTDIRDMSVKELRDTVSYVFQDSRIFRGTIADNVRLADPKASDGEVTEALKKAQCSEIIDKFDDGINTVLGTKGTYLSGGEIQRIAIARCFLKDSKIVILDEATAYADPENEKLVQAAFAELAKGRTVIMIAHRLSTVRNADRILVVKEGRVVEEGSHETLAKKGGVYGKMWENYQKSVAWKVGR